MNVKQSTIGSAVLEQTTPKLSVAFILLPGFTLFAFSGFIDALRIAGDEVDRSRQKECHWTVIAPTLEPVRSNSGIDVIPWEVFPDPAKFDYLVVIGGRVEPQRHTDPRILDYLQQAADKDVFIIGVCTATFVLARIGLMEGRECCVHWYHRTEFEEEFPALVVNSERVFIEDKRRITCMGGGSAADVALRLIDRHCGASSARKATAGMVIDGMRNDHTPQPHAEAAWYGQISNPLIRRAVVIMDRYIADPLSMEEIAARLQISENTLYRSFKHTTGVSPAKLLRIIRLAHGHWSVHHSGLSISRIAHHYQFSDTSHFTRLHRTFYGVTPAQARDLGPENCRIKMQALQSDKLIAGILAGGLFILS